MSTLLVSASKKHLLVRRYYEVENTTIGSKPIFNLTKQICWSKNVTMIKKSRGWTANIVWPTSVNQLGTVFVFLVVAAWPSSVFSGTATCCGVNRCPLAKRKNNPLPVCLSKCAPPRRLLCVVWLFRKCLDCERASVTFQQWVQFCGGGGGTLCVGVVETKLYISTCSC